MPPTANPDALAGQGDLEALAQELGYLFALGLAGQRLLAQSRNGRVRRPTTPGAPFLAHALQVTELAVRLQEIEKNGLVEVLEFQAEPQSWRRYPSPGRGNVTCKPDAYLRTAIGAFEDSWFIEVDRSTVGLSTIARQLDAYRRYWQSGIEQSWRGVFPRVLWLVKDDRRYQDLVDLCGRQPAESWQLYIVSRYDNAIPILTEGTS